MAIELPKSSRTPTQQDEAPATSRSGWAGARLGRRGVRALVAWAVMAAALLSAQPAMSASRSGLIVMPHPASRAGLSYFKLDVQPGSTAEAGTIDLQNPTRRPMRVALAAVDGQTLSTLGSSYATSGSQPHGSTLWIRLGQRAVTLAPGAGVVVPVTVAVPPGARSGDYLSGVSVEALEQHSGAVKNRGVSIASASRYAIGTEISLPGQRHPLIQLTGATIRREPAGLVFALEARNSGDVILQGVRGHVTVTRAGRVVASQSIQPGTFVAHTAVAYPVNAFHQTPAEGTHYEIAAVLRYPGGVARLHNTVTFGHQAAVAQQQYGGPSATSSGTSWWKIAGLMAVVLYGIVTTVLLLRRRARGGPERARATTEL